MNEFDNNDIVEYDLENFAVRDDKKTNEAKVEKVGKNTHSAKPKININFKKLAIIGVPAVALLTVAIIIIVSLLTPKNPYFGYIKDGEIFLTTVKDGAGVQITDDFLLDDGISITNISDYTRMTDNGKKIFYIDKFDGNSRNLYYREVNSKDTQAHKLSSDVDSFDINDKGTIVTYIKDDVDLFQHNLSEQSDKIDTDVTYFVASNDGKKILYYKDNTESDVKAKDLYLFVKGEKIKMLAENIETVRYISDDFDLVYYISESNLYKLEVGKSPTKISGDVREVIKVYDSGEVYFAKDNDNAEATLCYYDGKKEKSLIDCFYRAEAISSENPVLVVSSTEDKTMSYSIIVKGKATELKQQVVTVSMSKDGSQIFFLADTDPKTLLTTLYRADVKKELKDVKKVTDDVAYGKFVSDDVYVYLKDYNYEGGHGTLYTSEKKVAENVYWNSIKYCASDKLLFFFTDKKDNNGTLNCLADGKVKKIMKDVRIDSLSITGNDDVLFLHDFKNGEGILYAYDKNKTVKIDHDVSRILVFITNDQYDLLAKSYF